MASQTQDRIVVSCLLILAAVAIAVTLYLTRTMMIPFVLAIFLSHILTPMVDIFQLKLKLPRSLALVLTFGVTLLFLIVLGIFVTGNFQSLLEDTDKYRMKLIATADSIAQYTQSMGMSLDAEKIKEIIRELPFLKFAGKVVNVFTTGFLVLIFVIFLMAGARSSNSKKGIYAEIDHKIRRYLLTKLFTSGTTAVLVGTVLMIFGLDLALMIAILTFVLNFIPTIGSIIAVILPLPIAFLQFDSIPMVVAVLAIPGVIQFSIGNVLEPKLLGQSLDLHPASILLALMFWGLIWGTVGMILAVPIMAVLKIAMTRIEVTKPIAELLAGRLPEPAK